ncbi:MAG: M23 family metallopeptidase [Anaerolineae bacterium]|nr:MAG: M23 family metallopeptidase [Anaerolineae bacterium]
MVTLFIAHNEGEFSFLAHLQAGSLAVRSGEWVTQGQMVARCGNSGLSPGPHLHYHLQNGPHLYVDQGLPVRFSMFSVTGDRIAQASIPAAHCDPVHRR